MAWCCHNLLILLAAAFMAGIALAGQAGAGSSVPLFLLLGGAAAAVPALVLLWRLPLDQGLVWGGLSLFFCLGLIHGQPSGPLLDLKTRGQVQRLGALLAERTRVTVSGRLLDTADCEPGKQGLCRATLATEALLFPVDRRFVPVSGRMALRLRGAFPKALQAGDTVLALGWAQRPKTGGGVSDQGYEALLWLDNADALKRVPDDPAFASNSALSDTLPQGAAHLLRFGPERLRGGAARFLDAHFAPNIAGVYRALLLGLRQGLSPAAQEHFKICGCMHMLAISGLHVGLVATLTGALAYSLIRRSTRVLLSGRARALAAAAAVPPVLLYACLAGLNVPVVRALLTALLVLAALLVRRRRCGLHLAAAAALVVLVLRPQALFGASFQLSFAAVAAIILIAPYLTRLFPRSDGPGSSAASALHRGLRAFVVAPVLVSAAAALGTLPFMLWHFNRISLIGPLMNVVIGPLLCLWALPCGLVGLAFFLVGWEGPALVLLHLGEPAIRAALFLLRCASRLPVAEVWTITPHPLEICAYFAGLALLLRRGLGLRIAGAALLSGCLAVFTAGLWWTEPAPAQVRVTYIDVGQGASALVEVPADGRTFRLLVDCGGFQRPGYEVGSRRVAPLLWQRRIWRLDAALASHADSDHYSGLPFVLARFRPRTLFVNPGHSEEPGYQTLLKQARTAGIAVRPIEGLETVVRGGLTPFGPEPRLTILGPTAEETRSLGENDRSLLVRVQAGRRALLFPGDAAGEREARLLADPAFASDFLRADVLLAGHHGSIGSTTAPFLEAVDPKVIIVSAGASRQGIHPASEHLRRWRDRGIAVFATAEHGTIEARTDGVGLCLVTADGERCF